MLKASRFKWGVMFLASGVFAITGVLIFFVAPGGRVGGIIVFVFFGFCAAVGVVQLVFRPTLILAPAGFTLNTLGRQVTRQWDDIESFVVIGPAAFTKLVGINFREDYRGQGVRKVVRNVAGYETALPDTFGMKATDLVHLLNEWRIRYHQVGGNGPPSG